MNYAHCKFSTLRSCIRCDEYKDIRKYKYKKSSDSYSKTCCECLEYIKVRTNAFTNRKNKYNLKNEYIPDYIFDINISNSSTYESERLEKVSDPDIIKKYANYISSLRNRTVNQITTDLRLNRYCLKEMLESGQLDHFGHYTSDRMKEIRMSCL